MKTTSIRKSYDTDSDNIVLNGHLELDVEDWLLIGRRFPVSEFLKVMDGDTLARLCFLLTDPSIDIDGFKLEEEEAENE